MYSALLLGRIMDYVPKKRLREGPGAYTINGFTDMGMVAFGPVGKVFISCIFVVETFGYACVYFIIEGENLKHQLHAYPFFATWRRTDFMVRDDS
ncbi:hypothetical protein T484DRAFT_1911657 [Baffinella frigidus]|nr:hypothetical protein T484DRAFT_1911657 [Cryptophyta sp. CCMP2293]